MAHPVLWPKKSFFYPIGNTPATSLVQDLAPGEDAKVLLLGCGDPRNILYTAFSSESTFSTGPQVLDFTCCDLEPATLARNVVLLTMIADDQHLDRATNLWNIFYHFYLDEGSLSLLLAQCRKLIQASETLETWYNSRYGQFIRMCTAHTLSELRRYWTFYVRTENFSEGEKRRFKNAYSAGAKRKFTSTTVNHPPFCPSAGPFLLEAIEILPESLKRYWNTGLVSLDDAEIARASFVNPTLAYSVSGEPFPLYHVTNPIATFHLAEALAPEASSDQSSKLHALHNTAKRQFKEWCNSFRAALGNNQRPGRITVRLFVGDALAFSYALHHLVVHHTVNPGLYTSSWSSVPLILDGGGYHGKDNYSAPVSFNVIDTSNLADHLGFLNILIASAPLLSKQPTSVFYTEFIPNVGEGTADFLKRVCIDIPTLSLMLDISPLAYLSHFDSRSNVHKTLSHLSNIPHLQYWERVKWRIPYTGDKLVSCHHPDHPIVFEPKPLARFFFNVYGKMFADQNKQTMSLLSPFEMMSLQGDIHYLRASLAAFIRIVKRRVRADWGALMGEFMHIVTADRTHIMSMSHFPELCCQLHLLGVYTHESLANPFLLQMQQAHKSSGRFRKWKTVPPVVCVVFSVPRNNIEVLERLGTQQTKSLILQCEVRRVESQDIFSSINIDFGKASLIGFDEDAKVVIAADPDGWSGKSGWVVSVDLPSWILMSEPHKISVMLSLYCTLQSPALMSKIGFDLSLFTAPFMDEERVFVVKERPNLPRVFGVLSETLMFNQERHPIMAGLDSSSQKVITLTARADIAGVEARNIWASGFPVNITQTSPCTMRVTSGGFEQTLAFTFPVDGSQYKGRIARKSFYVEIDAHVFRPTSKGGYGLDYFPVVRRESKPASWNIHRVDLDLMPLTNARRGWFASHISLMMSKRENEICKRTRQPVLQTRDDLVLLKDSIKNLLIAVAGQPTRRNRVFGLSDPTPGSPSPRDTYAFLLVADLRFDTASQSIVADTYILPNNSEIEGWVLRQLLPDKVMVLEVDAWRQILPALTDRCRKWDHTVSCEYLSSAGLKSRSPICGCGRGVDVTAAFRGVSEWKSVTPYVTRAAIGPLFAVSYLEDRVSLKLQNQKPGAGKGSCCAACGKGDGGLRACGGCKYTRYCSLKCQKEDWKRHKMLCQSQGRFL